MITILHLARDLPHELRLSVTSPLVPDFRTAMDDGTYDDKKAAMRVAAAKLLLAQGGYEEVAVFAGDDPDEAYRMTQNGITRPSDRFHLLSDEQRQGVTATDIEIAEEYAMRGDIDRISKKVQNVGAMLSSWSRLPDPGITTVGENCHWRGLQAYGRKSSEVGDIFIINGVFHVVDSFGFAEFTYEVAA